MLRMRLVRLKISKINYCDIRVGLDPVHIALIPELF